MDHDIPYSWGTAVNVMPMVFGNLNNNSGTGVAFTRNPATGEKGLMGEFLVNAQGEDVVAGVRTPMKIAEMKDRFPEAYDQFLAVCDKLEKHYRDMQDMEFTIENGKLYISDFKTSKKSLSRNQVPDKGYLRQLYIYSRMLLANNIITKKEYDNLGFKIYFFNWNSGNSAIYEFDKKEVDKCSAYVNFILSWYWNIKNGTEDVQIKL